MTLGRHVGWISRNFCQNMSQSLQINVSGDAQVSDFGSEVVSEQDVGSSEVTMDEGRGQRVEIVKSLGYIIQDMDSSGDIRVSMGFNEISQVGMKPLHY